MLADLYGGVRKSLPFSTARGSPCGDGQDPMTGGASYGCAVGAGVTAG